MKKYNIIALFIFVSGILSTNAQTIIGKWKTIDDETGNEKSIVEIFQENGKVYAKIIQLLEKDKEDKLCDLCSGSKKNKPVKGMTIIDDLTKNGNEWSGGKILDPKTGKEYKCYISLEGANKLKVRGFIGFALLGRTQYWHKVN
ncbi:DUF2147 domain-containing protein [Lutibacter sp.]|uniref:DUF2147 domain-containing protein n=1 Tax=Lutibacter sp. TaxID=1925666 RepID=UPI002736E04A|nr:DUF2147 domain-containing protein [Lutibacter sp.]MDP3312883.1 DUF2147 domain-containing protein [Lutibacter sp.]